MARRPKSGRTFGSHEFQGADPRTEPMKNWKELRLFFVVLRVAVSWPGAPVPLSLSLGLWCFLLGDVPKTDHFRLATAGVTFLLPDGRDVGSEQGHRPKNRYFQVSPPAYVGLEFLFGFISFFLIFVFISAVEGTHCGGFSGCLHLCWRCHSSKAETWPHAESLVWRRTSVVYFRCDATTTRAQLM